MSRGEWMQTFTGRAFYPMDPRPEDVDPADIAHALSMICRYGGHPKVFYSVAEHSVLMSYAVNPGNALWALLHDASEAYVGDMVRPLKRAMPAYQLAEARVNWAVCRRFGISEFCPPEVRQADLRILHDERAALMATPPLDWSALEGTEPLGVIITGWLPAVAERRYLDRMAELFALRYTGALR